MPDRRRPLLTAVVRLAQTIVWLLAIACMPAGVHAAPDAPHDAIVARAWLDDPESALSPQAALERPWTVFTDSLSRGYTASTTWLRLKIDPAMATPGRLASDHRLVLRILPGHLDEVAVFRADRLTQSPVKVGDAIARGETERSFSFHAVVFDDVTQPFEVLLRLRTQSNHSIHVQALSWDDARDTSFSQFNQLLGYLVFTIMVFAWALVSWIDERDIVLGLFMAHQASAFVLTLTLMGVLRMVGPDWLTATMIDRTTSMVIPLYTASTGFFHARLLADLGLGRAGNRLLLGLSAMPVIGLLLVVLGAVRPGLMLTQGSVPLIMPTLVVLILLAREWRARTDRAVAEDFRSVWWRAYMVLVYVAMAALFMPQALRVLGLMPAGVWSYSGFIAYSIGSTALLGSLLVVRSRQKNRRRLQAERQILQTRQEAEVQRARAAEQAEMMTMLTHELKTPLSVLSLALGDAGRMPSIRARAFRAMDNMRNVIDRCAQASLVDDATGLRDTSLAIAPVNMSDLVTDAVNGQLLGDQVDCSVAVGLPACRSDRQILAVIIGNLLENALKYGPEEGRVQLSVTPNQRKDQQGVALRVTNQVGLSGRPDPSHLFEKYHRGALARRQSGSGLGLYLSHQLAVRLGAELSLHDGDTDEVCFELWLPR
jgi:signal transduction histidine kinase